LGYQSEELQLHTAEVTGLIPVAPTFYSAPLTTNEGFAGLYGVSDVPRLSQVGHSEGLKMASTESKHHDLFCRTTKPQPS